MKEVIKWPTGNVMVMCVVCEGLGVICKSMYQNELCRHCEGTGRIVKGSVYDGED